MGRIIYLMGKSASGKDSLYAELLADEGLNLTPLVTYTTRPMRDHEQEGVQYHFIGEEQLQAYARDGRVIEQRMYPSVLGPWYYATIDDGKTDFRGTDFIVIGTLESYRKVVQYFAAQQEICVVPVYLEVEDGLRLKRAIAREEAQDTQNYEEMCRRFLADQQDFSEEKIAQAGIRVRFDNGGSPSECLRRVKEYLG